MKRLLRFIIAFTAMLVLAGVLAAQIWSRTKTGAVQISQGEPAVWSLEQAHYLLETARKRNAELRLPAELVLDPNDVNGARYDLLHTLFSLEGEFNQSIGFNNQNSINTRASNAEKLSAANVDKTKLDTELAVLQKQRDALTATILASNASPDQISVAQSQRSEIDTQIAAKKDAVAASKASIAKLAVPDDVKVGGTGPGAVPLPPLTADIMTDAIKRIVAANDPKLSATQKLDNRLNFGYELIAKQLTQLRDEAGPGRRVIFLELPHSIHAVPGRSKNHWVQGWWRVTRIVRPQGNEVSRGCPAPTMSDVGVALGQAMDASDKEAKLKLIKTYTQSNSVNYRFLDKLKGPDDAVKGDAIACWKNLQAEELISPVEGTRSATAINPPSRRASPVRTIELIPGKQSLTMAEVKAKISQKSFAGIVRLISGFGVQGQYQRTREAYEQFLTQQVYASSFGKGFDEFGWTFRPLPNADYLEPGVRNTFAVMSVPLNAVAMEIEAVGCAFHAKTSPPDKYPTEKRQSNADCNPEYRRFVLLIPPPRNAGFWINHVDFQPTVQGSPLTVIFRGRDISPQMGLLINGIPLQQVAALGSPELWRDAGVRNSTSILGEFEWLNSESLIAKFQMPDDFVGIPDITLIAPSKAESVFDFANVGWGTGKCISPRDAGTQAMFIGKPSILRVVVVNDYAPKAAVNLEVTGSDFRTTSCSGTTDCDVWQLNGEVLADVKVLSPSIASIKLPARPDEASWHFTLRAQRGARNYVDSIDLLDPWRAEGITYDSKNNSPTYAVKKDGEESGAPVVCNGVVNLKADHLNSSMKILLDQAAFKNFSMVSQQDLQVVFSEIPKSGKSTIQACDSRGKAGKCTPGASIPWTKIPFPECGK